MENSASITITIAYAATAQCPQILTLTLPSGSTIQQALMQAQCLDQQAVLPANLLQQTVGIFGKTKPMETVLRMGDRIEIYRPLRANPNSIRQQRAIQKKR